MITGYTKIVEQHHLTPQGLRSHLGTAIGTLIVMFQSKDALINFW